MPDGMTPEIPQTPESPIQKWGNEVKKQIKNGQALGSVTAHTNFDVVRDKSGDHIIAQSGITDYNKGAGIFLRGNISKKTESDIYNFLGAINSSTQGFPHSTDENTLYVTIVKVTEESVSQAIKADVKKLVDKIASNESLIEIRYKQPRSDESHRTSEKWIHLIVQDEIANELQEMLHEGIDPNKLHDAIVDIFTTPEKRQYFDATKIDPDDNSTILISPETPKFEKTYLSTIQEDPVKPILRQTIEPGKKEEPDSEKDTQVQEARRTEILKVPSTPEQPPEPPGPPEPPTSNPETPEEPEKPKFEPSWLIKDKKEKEIFDGITSPKVKLLIRSLNGEIKRRKLDIRSWDLKYVELLDLQADPANEADFDAIDVFLLNISEGIRKMDTEAARSTRASNPETQGLQEAGEALKEAAVRLKGSDLSGIGNESKDEQLRRARESLEEIEANTYPLDHQINAHNYQQLANALKNERLSPEVVKEVQARLRLHACFTLVERVSGKPEDYVASLRDIVTEMRVRELLLEGEDFEQLYKPDKKENDLGISKAHAVLEKLAFNGVPTILDEEGKPVRYAGRMTSEEASKVNAYILDQLGGDSPETRRAVVLAERLAKATFEYSLWKDFRSLDAITKAAYFSNARKEALKTGGDFGPAITIELIDGFATSFLRWATYTNKTHIFHEEQWQEAGKLNKRHEMRKAMDVIYKITCIRESMGETGRPKGQSYEDFHIDTTAPDYKRLPSGSYGLCLALYLPSVVNTTMNLLKSDFKPSETTEDNLVNWIGNAIRADASGTPNPPGTDPKDPPLYPTKGIFRLPYYFVMGMVESAVRQATLLTWDAPQMGSLLNMLKRPVRFDPETSESSMLLSSEQINKIVKVVHPYRRLAINTAIAGFERIVRTRGG